MKLHQRRAVTIGTEAFVNAEIHAEEALSLKLTCLQTLLAQHRSARLLPEDGADALVHIGRGIALSAEAVAEMRRAHPVLRGLATTLNPSADFGTSPTQRAVPFAEPIAERDAA